jgi:hypothetical protein
MGERRIPMDATAGTTGPERSPETEYLEGSLVICREFATMQ